jgi:hypothetical protein
VITCLPDSWTEEDGMYTDGSPDVLERIVRSVQANYWQITSPLDLALTVVEHCAGNTTESTTDNGEELENLNYLDWFYLSIKQVVSCMPPLHEEVWKAYTSR